MEHNGATRELHRDVFLRIERVGQFTLVIVVLGVEAMSHISREEEVAVEIGCGDTRKAHSVAIDEVSRDDGIDRTYIKL